MCWQTQWLKVWHKATVDEAELRASSMSTSPSSSGFKCTSDSHMNTLSAHEASGCFLGMQMKLQITNTKSRHDLLTPNASPIVERACLQDLSLIFAHCSADDAVKEPRTDETEEKWLKTPQRQRSINRKMSRPNKNIFSLPWLTIKTTSVSKQGYKQIISYLLSTKAVV